MSISNLLSVIASLTILLTLTNHASVVVGQGFVQDSSSRPGDRSVFQYNRGGLISTIQYLKLDQSPFNFYEDVIVSKSGKLVIQEGVVVNFAPRKGLFVQGSLVAVGSPSRRIQFTRQSSSSSNTVIPTTNYVNSNYNNVPSVVSSVVVWPDVRLVDGDTPNEGRLQIKTNNHWHSVCTNSKNWTMVDIRTVCNQLGFADGSWYQWFNKFNDSRQLMIEEPGCLDRESRIDHCPNWTKRQVGSGACDYHSDIGIRCTKRLVNHGSSSSYNVNPGGTFWSGIKFLSAEAHDEYLPQFDGRLKRKISDSILDNVDITYAGEDVAGESIAAIHVKGVPPQIMRTSVRLSAGTGINVTDSTDGFVIKETVISENRGYGLFVNSTWGQVNLHGVRIENNGADGIRYNLQQDLQTGDDFCYFSNLGENQVYPIRITHEQKSSSLTKSICCQEFRIRNLNNRDAQLTVHFPYMVSGIFEGPDERDRHRVTDGFIEVFDGYDKRSVLKFMIRNDTKIPSVTSSESRLQVCYQPAILKRVLFTVIVTTDFGKAYDLNITKSIIKNNNGRGVWVENQRSGTVLNHTIVSNHTYVAGIHIQSGAGDLIVNNSHVTHNFGDGINASISHGCRHIDRTEVSMNTARGIALWTNESSYQHLDFADAQSINNQRPSYQSQGHQANGQSPRVITSVTYSEVWGNLGVGVFVSNVCRSDSFVNISMNAFKSNRGDAIEIFSCHEKSNHMMSMLVNNNKFIDNHRLAMRMAPIFNLKNGVISHNLFKLHSKGVIYINNQDKEDDVMMANYEELPVSLMITDNIFIENSGLFVASVGVLQESSVQEIEFSQNILEHNLISQSYAGLNPRSRVAAVVVVSSSNTRLIRNNFVNPGSRYEIGCHLDTDHSAVINASFNYYGEISRNERTADIYDRIFDRKNRYNLAQIEFLQYRTNPYDFKTNELLSIDRERDKFVPFRRGQLLGGEVRGFQTLETGVYSVTKDIFVRPGSRLTINQGATLIFDQSIGMMVQGKLESSGSYDYPIKFTGGAAISSNVGINPSLIASRDGRRDELIPPFIDTRPKDVPPSISVINDPINSVPSINTINEEIKVNPDPVLNSNPVPTTVNNNDDHGRNPFIRIHNPRLNDSVNPDDFAAGLGPNTNISNVPLDAWTRTGWPREETFPRDSWTNNKWGSGQPSSSGPWSSRRSKRQTVVPSSTNVRLSGGHEGRLEVNIGGTWGSVCSYGFDIQDAAIACQQMGLVLNSRDWLLERSQFMSNSLSGQSSFPSSTRSQFSSNYSTSSPSKVEPILSKLKCTNIDTDILNCDAESAVKGDFYNSCPSEVGIKCYTPTWSGIRLGMAAEESVMSNTIIEKAGLLDYSTHVFKPALQVDFHRHRLSRLTIQENADVGVGFMWTELFLEQSLLSLSNSLIYSNQHHGISTRNQGLRVFKCEIDRNQGSGFNYDPMFSRREQKDLISWIVNSVPSSFGSEFQPQDRKLLHWPGSDNNNLLAREGRHSNYFNSYQFIDEGADIKLDPSKGSSWYLKINEQKRKNFNSWFTISTAVEHSLGIMVLNPSYGTDNLTLSNTASDYIFDIKKNLSSFPLLKYSYKLSLNYSSGHQPRGDIVLYISVKPLRNYRSAFDLIKTEMDENKIIKTIRLESNNFNGNYRGVSTNHYNLDIGRDGEYYHRHSNETLILTDNIICGSTRDALLINSPLYDPLVGTGGSLSEINITLISNNLTRNAKGISQYSRDMRASNNLFHFVINGSIIEFNQGPILIAKLPYVWSYNENFTHSVSIHNNSIFRNKNFEFLIDGFFARVNITDNLFKDNHAREGLIEISGMEKELLIQDNVIDGNFGHFMVEFDIKSHADQFGLVSANLRRNIILNNRDTLDLINPVSFYHPSSYTIAIRGVQYINMTRNLLRNPNLQYELLTGVLTGSLETVINVQENWWGFSNYSAISARIFDFDDWNSYAIAHFSPYLGTEHLYGPLVMSDYTAAIMDTDRPFGGRVHHNLFLRKRSQPYIVTSDLTIMPGAVLSIEAGVEIVFFPSVGVLVLGEMTVAGYESSPVVMKPARLMDETRLFRFKRSDDEDYNDAEDDDDDYLLRGRKKRQINSQSSRADNVFLTKDSRPYFHDASDITDVRLCITESCSEWTSRLTVINPDDVMKGNRLLTSGGRRRDGYLEVYNQTSLEWISVCDPRFTERNAQVVCSFLGHSALNVHLRRGRRVDMNPTLISRVRYWPEPLECSGKERALKDCDIRLNGYGNHSHACSFDGDNFVYIYCGPEPEDHEIIKSLEKRGNRKNVNQNVDLQDKISDSYWGGIRFAQATFEQTSSYQQVRPNSVAIDSVSSSRLQHLNIIGAGILHGEKNAALQMVNRDVSLEFVNISNCASHGIEAVAPSGHLRFANLNIYNNLGSGINYILLGTASTSSARVPYKPLSESTIPKHIYGLVNICDPNKNLLVEERVLVYYKYDNEAVDCVKIFKSTRQNKQLGFRMLQFNLFNSTNYTSISDSVKIYDGDIFNQTVKMIGDLGVSFRHKTDTPENRMYVSTKKSYHDSLSVRLHASGASFKYGFVAEVVTLPSSYFVPRGFAHNLTYSSLNSNVLGAVTYKSAGEVAPSINFNFNRIEDNCDKLLDNFTTCNAALNYELQNTPTFWFSNNLIRGNQGGLSLETNAQTAAGALNAFLINNLFDSNLNNEALSVTGPDIGAQQIIEVADNYFTNNYHLYKPNINLKQVVANFTRNVVVSNVGLHQLMVIGIDNSFQTIRKNWFYNNHAQKVNEKSTLFASNPGQQYSENYLVNPDNDFELATKNRSYLFENIKNIQDRQRERERDRKSFIDARNNWWGFNETTAVLSRILDGSDYEDFVRVDFRPFHQSNQSVLSGICSGGWERVGHTCVMYVGSRMTYNEAKYFCESQNSTMPVVSTSNQRQLTKFLKSKQDNYDERYFRVWVQSFAFLIDDCTILLDNQVTKNPCHETLPFFCEKDPDIHVLINAEWYREPLGVAALAISTITFSLTFCCICCWLFKSREKAKEKLQRRNSIRASIRSNRSFVGSSNHSLNEIAYKRQMEKVIMSRNPNGGSQQLRTTDFNGSANSAFGRGASRGPSFDSLDKRGREVDEDEVGTFRSSQASLGGRGGVQMYDRNRNDLEDRFAADPGLENATVDMMVHPTFDLTFENEAFREGTPSGQSRGSAWTDQPSPRGPHVPDGHRGQQNGGTNGHTRKAPPPPVAPRFGPSARLLAQQVAPPSPSSIGHFSRRSVSPLPDNRFNTYETFKSMGGQSSMAGSVDPRNIAAPQRTVLSTFQSAGSIGPGSDITSASGARADALTREIRQQLSIRDPMDEDTPYLETSLDGESFRADNAYDYCDYTQRMVPPTSVSRALGRFSPSVSMTTLDSSKEQPLETAM